MRLLFLLVSYIIFFMYVGYSCDWGVFDMLVMWFVNYVKMFGKFIMMFFSLIGLGVGLWYWVIYEICIEIVRNYYRCKFVYLGCFFCFVFCIC